MTPTPKNPDAERLALLALLPDDGTLDAVDDNAKTGNRPCPVTLTINQVRQLLRALEQREAVVGEYRELAAARAVERADRNGALTDKLMNRLRAAIPATLPRTPADEGERDE